MNGGLITCECGKVFWCETIYNDINCIQCGKVHPVEKLPEPEEPEEPEPEVIE